MGRVSLLAAGLLAPALALAHEPETPKSDMIGSIEFSAGLWDSAFGVQFESSRGFLAEESVSSTLGVIPAVEWPLGRTVHAGAELLLLWFDDPFWAFDERRPLTGISLRMRLSFPVHKGITADVLAAPGPRPGRAIRATGRSTAGRGDSGSGPRTPGPKTSSPSFTFRTSM